ncbi:MAG: helix-turn-helix domain-containing protein [Sulfuricaulis sp.]|uniref:helix-turn-helix domain-containing protein n=1 Tax=Sulfuricaulis sp. TaxID=2003553 RepID=UPI0034A1B3CA
MRSANLSGLRIKQAREKRGLDQVDLAAALSVDHDIKMDQSDISEIERGIRGVKDFELDAIARVLDVSTVWLLRGKEKDG